VTFNRACGNEECLCYLAVGEALAGELGDTALAGCQGVEPRENDPARARAGGAKLGLGLFGKRSGAGAVGGVECLAEELSRFASSISRRRPSAEPEVRIALQRGPSTRERLSFR
jgi:hypothetical protein